MTDPLPWSGQEMRLFVLALREFSNDCTAPQLTPSCPFYRVYEGEPFCLEECMDLLGANGDSEPVGLEVFDGWHVSRMNRRPRRAMHRSSKPFDAGEVHISDKTRPLAEWRPAALLAELRDQSGPPTVGSAEELAMRPQRVSATVEALQPWGIDGERFLRTVLVAGMAHAIVMMSVVPILLGSSKAVAELPAEMETGAQV